MTLLVRVHLREWVLNLSAGAVLASGSSVFMTAPAVFVAVPSLVAVRTAVLMGLSYGGGLVIAYFGEFLY